MKITAPSEVLASAPGKLFITGEYAVLEGAPALVMPVSQRAVVSRVAGADCQVRSDLDRSLPGHEIPLLQSILEELSEGNLVATGSAESLCLDTRAFFASVDGVTSKLGLGASAALTAALLKTLFPKPVAWTVNKYVALAMACHLRLQGGRGSGADVAVAITDKLLCFRRGEQPVPHQLPAGFFFGFVWTGRGAGTVNYLNRMQHFKDTSPQHFDELMRPLIETATETSRPDLAPDELGASISEMDRCLKALSVGSGTGFYSDIHVELCNLVTRSGGVYKPSGAGGGDFGLVVAKDADELMALNRRLSAARYRTDLVTTDRFSQEME